MARVKRYAIKKIFDTIQGEGARAGTRAVFVRFAGCNLWTGRPEDRGAGKGACARWCDTDFAKAEAKLSATELVWQVNALWPKKIYHRKTREHDGSNVQHIDSIEVTNERWVVLTGGEPMLQVDEDLLAALNAAGLFVAVETNGSLPLPDGDHFFDWVTVSPKIGAELVVEDADELKVVVPGVAPGLPGWSEEMLLALDVAGDWNERFVQPMDPLQTSDVEDTLLHPRSPVEPPWTPAAQERRELFKTAQDWCVAFVKKHPRWRVGAQLHKALGIP